MKAIKRIGIAAVIFCIFLTGCGTSMVKLTEEEENIIVAYASGSVAKNNRYMLKGLRYPKEEEEEEEEEQPVAPKPEEEAESVPVPDQGDGQPEAGTADPQPAGQTATLAEAVGQGAITAEYRGYELRQNYIVGDYFALNAGAGMTYLVLNIGLVNTSQEPVECNMFARNVDCSIYINEVLTANAVNTVLTEDFVTYMGTLDAASGMY